MLDPHNMTVNKFEGDKKDSEAWRTNIENYLCSFYPDIDKSLPYLRRIELPIRSAKNTCKQR